MGYDRTRSAPLWRVGRLAGSRQQQAFRSCPSRWRSGQRANRASAHRKPASRPSSPQPPEQSPEPPAASQPGERRLGRARGGEQASLWPQQPSRGSRAGGGAAAGVVAGSAAKRSRCARARRAGGSCRGLFRREHPRADIERIGLGPLGHARRALRHGSGTRNIFAAHRGIDVCLKEWCWSPS